MPRSKNARRSARLSTPPHRSSRRRLLLQPLESRRLLVGDNEISEAIPAVIGVNTAEIDNPLDVDMWSVDLLAGQTIGIDIDSIDYVDAAIRVFDGAGNELAEDDASRGPGLEYGDLEAFLTFEAPSTATYYVGVSSFSNISYDPVTGSGATAGDSIGFYDLIIGDAPDEYLFIVNSTDDSGDTNPGDGFAEDATGMTTLRAAIEESNAVGGDDSIVEIVFDFENPLDVSNPFAVPDPTTGRYMIQPATPLPAIMEPVFATAYGLFALNFPPLQIDGLNVSGGATDGLRITGDSVGLEGFAISNFPGDGIDISGSQASTLFSNLVFDNGANGIRLNQTADSSVEGNQVLDNGKAGIQIVGATSTGNVLVANSVGQNTFDSLSTPEGNGTFGIQIASALNTLIANQVVGNQNVGIAITDPTADLNRLVGNYVGTDYSGANSGNSSFGILVRSSNNTIGEPGFGNTISGNGRSGLVLSGPSANNNVVQGNYIGTNDDGSVAVPNSAFGIFVTGANNNTIGGAFLEEGNVVSGNGGSGVAIATNASGNVVEGNAIGLNGNRDDALPNGSTGIFLRAGANNTQIRGNSIAGNPGTQLLIAGASTTNNVVASNLIGLDDFGAVVPGGSNAIFIQSPGNTVGGATISEANFIGGSATGITLSQPSASNNSIANNYIGSDGFFDFGMTTGIRVTNGAHENTLGPGNSIGFNSARAIQVTGSNTVENTITENSLFDNGFGIDLLPPGNALNPNDAGDADTGANELQNSATSLAVDVTIVSASSLSISIDYFVDSDPSEVAYPLRVEFFSAVFDPANPDTVQGEIFVGFDEFQASDFANGGTNYTVVTSSMTGLAGVTHGTATVTDANGNTSEFTTPALVNVLNPPSVASVNSNPLNPLDVNGHDGVTPLDLLLVFDGLSQQAAGAHGESAASSAMTDTNGDGKTSPADALAVINYLAEQAAPVSASTEARSFLSDWSDDDEEDDALEPWDAALMDIAWEV
ncbi:right-handed parallel beta-helix repeat-containing protein [Planctomycetes bacterium K23_9]|uniref:Dockerin type I repeat protein n=1 Tax=Stieleria marina TaxID=1930275 RepID=A0A517NRH1_9BACT|nr:hypothetical protein K239x_16630 [Planctomycetes bacterium K23_9]